MTRAASAARAARATTAPSSLTGPPKRQGRPRPVAATTTASVEVPLASVPSPHRTPAAARSAVFTSVIVMTAFTSAAGSGAASTTTIALIVDGIQTAAGATPAAMRLLSPTVTTARAPRPCSATSARSAVSVWAEVRSPIHGAGTPRRAANSASRASRPGSATCFGTCRFTIARAAPRPPPTTAEETAASGARAVTTTASRSAATSTPSIRTRPAGRRVP